uniref:CYP81B36 n=2 Tax=Solanum tuberosum TaxID=4113 RepID=M1BXZ4_SOLTU
MDNLYLYFPVLFLVHYIISRHFLNKLQNLPPSPFPTLPFIGHLYLLSKPFHRALFKVSNRYGSVVFLQFGSRPVLLVSSPLVAEDCFTKNDIIFANRPDFLSGKYFGYNFTSLAWSSYGEHWRNLRRISTLEVLSSYRIQTLSSIRSDKINYLIRRLFRVSIENLEKIVEMKSSLFNFTFNVISRMIAGKRYYGENSKEAMLFQDISKETINTTPKANILDFLPFMRWFGLHSVEEKMMELQKKRDNFMRKEIDEHRRLKTSGSFPSAEVVAGKKKTIMEVLLDLQKTDPEYYTDETIRNLLLILLQAGSDISAVTLEWAFSRLLDNREILKTAQTEIDNQVGQDRMNPIWLNFLTSDASSMRHCGCIQQPLYLCLTFHQKSAKLQDIEFRVEQSY